MMDQKRYRETEGEFRTIDNIKFRIVRSSRKTLAITILPDSSVTVRVSYRTSLKAIDDLVRLKSAWIKKHLTKNGDGSTKRISRDYAEGVNHLFRGIEYPLKISYSNNPYVRIEDNSIALGLAKPDEPKLVR